MPNFGSTEVDANIASVTYQPPSWLVQVGKGPTSLLELISCLHMTMTCLCVRSSS